MAQYYSCNLDGQCEVDPASFHSLADCQRDCQALGGLADTKEAAYIILEYNLEQALEAAPSDRVQLIRRLTGVSVPPEDSWNVLMALLTKDYYYLYYYPLEKSRELEPKILRAYIMPQLDEFDLLLLELLDEPPPIPVNWEAIKIQIHWQLRRFLGGANEDNIAQILEDDPVQTVDELTAVVKGEVGYIIQHTFYIQTYLSPEQIEEIIDRYWD